MRYSGDELAEIAEKIDIVDYISQTEELHRMGQYYTTRCCFHQGDDTPSLRVYPDTQSWYCFGCHKGGRIFQWVQMKDELPFGKAVEKVANIAGIELRKRIKTPSMQFLESYQKQEIQTTKPNVQRVILDWQKDYYDKYSDELPEEWLNEDMTAEALRHYNIRIDHSSNRIVYPVLDANGNFISVKGRTRIKGYKALKLQKYINYQKIGTIDFFAGYQQASEEISNKKSVVIFEGIKSCIKCWGWGIRNTIASETSKLSDGQLELLIQYGIPEITIGWDSDKPFKEIISDSKIQMLKRFSKVYVITNHIGEKTAPVDGGKETYLEVYKNRRII